MYVIRTEIYNEGVKYTDAFFVATQYCLFQLDAEHSSLRMSTELKYIKNVNGIIKCKRILYIFLLDVFIF